MSIDTVSANISHTQSPEYPVKNPVIGKETIKAILSLGIPGTVSEKVRTESHDKTSIDTFA